MSLCFASLKLRVVRKKALHTRVYPVSSLRKLYSCVHVLGFDYETVLSFHLFTPLRFLSVTLTCPTNVFCAIQSPAQTFLFISSRFVVQNSMNRDTHTNPSYNLHEQHIFSIISSAFLVISDSRSSLALRCLGRICRLSEGNVSKS